MLTKQLYCRVYLWMLKMKPLLRRIICNMNVNPDMLIFIVWYKYSCSSKIKNRNKYIISLICRVHVHLNVTKTLIFSKFYSQMKMELKTENQNRIYFVIMVCCELNRVLFNGNILNLLILFLKSVFSFPL